MITVGDEKPAWVPERLRDMVLTPAEAKGLEYQSVCVLDPGRVLSRLEAAGEAMAAYASQALREHEHRTEIDQLRVALSRATETLAFVDVAGDDEAHALSAELLEDAAPYDADDLVEHFADDAPPDERVQARTRDARALIDTAPGRAWQRACQAMRLLGDPQLPNGVSDETVRIEAHTTLLATAARLLVDGIPAAVRRHELVNMAAEAVVLLRATDHYGRAFEALDAWTQAPQAPPFALLDATLGLDSDGRTGCGRRCRRWRSGCATPSSGSPASRPRPAPTPATSRAGCRLTGYAGDAVAKARALRCRAIDALTAAGETLGAAQVLVTVEPLDLARLARLREAQGRLADAAETFEAAGMPADALRNWRAAGKWEQAVRLAEGQVRSDLEWLAELEALTRRRPAGQRKRLTPGERERLVQLLDSIERLARSGRTAAAAAAMPLVILPALGPGLPAGFVEADGMPPVPDKARTGRSFGRRVMAFQNWTLASNPRWKLTDEQLALLWQAEFPNSRTRYTMRSVRTVRNGFNQGRRNNDRPAAPVPEYDPAGNPVVSAPPYF